MVEEMTSRRADDLLRRPRQDRGLTEGQIVDQWTEWLYAEHGAGLPRPVLDAVWGKAYEDGHSAGMQEIEGYFVELVGLAERIIAAVR